MSKMEIQSFVDLAPNYINYTLRALRENRPTSFCKIVGAFRIVFKNAQTNAASKQDLLVMENLFYKKNVTRKFDLKGSERNRLVSASEAGLNDCVLLDENFVQSRFYHIETFFLNFYYPPNHAFLFIYSDMGEPTLRQKLFSERPEQSSKCGYSVSRLPTRDGLLTPYRN